MLAQSTRDRSRSPVKPSTEESTSNPTESTTSHSKARKEGEFQQRMRKLKSFIQKLITESTSLGSNYDEQVKTLEKACAVEYHDIPSDRTRRMIKSLFKAPKPPSNSTNAFLHQDHSTITDHAKRNRSNSIPNIPSTKPPDLVTSPTSTLSAFDADFLRHAFAQQFRPTLDLSAYFSIANGTNSTSSLFRPNFSPSNFLQSLTNIPAPPLPPPPLVSLHTNGTTDSSLGKSSKQGKLPTPETSSIRVLVNAYREAASYLSRSADELEQLI